MSAPHPAGGTGGEKNSRDQRAARGGFAIPRLRAGGNFLQKAADPHPGNIRIADLKPRRQPFQYQISPVQLWRAGATGEAEHRAAVKFTDEKEISRVHRHAETLDPPACRLHCCRADIATVGSGGAAKDQNDIAFHPAECFCQRGGFMGGDYRCACVNPEGGEPRGDSGGPFFDQRGFHALRLCQNERGLAQHKWMQAQRPGKPLRRCFRGINRGGIGDDFHRRQHLALRHAGEIRQGGDGNGLIHSIRRIDRPGIDAKQAGAIGIDIHPPGEGRGNGEMLPGHGCRDQRRRFILRQIIRAEPRGPDFGNASGDKRGHILPAQDFPLRVTLAINAD